MVFCSEPCSNLKSSIALAYLQLETTQETVFSALSLLCIYIIQPFRTSSCIMDRRRGYLPINLHDLFELYLLEMLFIK